MDAPSASCGRKNPLPFSHSLSSLIATVLNRERGENQRVETAGVYPLVRPRGVSALPAEVQRKTPRPERADTPAAVRVPRSVGAEMVSAHR